MNRRILSLFLVMALVSYQVGASLVSMPDQNAVRFLANQSGSSISAQKARELLGLSVNFTEKDVEQAFRKLALKMHPDRMPANMKQQANQAIPCTSFCWSIEPSAYPSSSWSTADCANVFPMRPSRSNEA